MPRTARSSPYETRGLDWTRRVLITSLTHSTHPNREAWAWDYRSAVQSSKLTADVYGLQPTYRGMLFFFSSCPHRQAASQSACNRAGLVVYQALIPAPCALYDR